MTKILSGSKVSSMVIGDNIPDGATVTPVDDYTIWLRCADIPDAFGSLANVLAGSTVMTTLMSSENAVNYMLRSITNTSGKILYEVVNSETAMEALDASSVALTGAFNTEEWFAAMMGSSTAIGVLDATAKKIPTMTGNTTPSGVASASSEYAGYPAYKAFDKSTASGWNANSSSNAWLRYQFTSAYVPYKIIVNTGNQSFNLTYQVSNDGTSFTDVESFSTIAGGAEYGTDKIVLMDSKLSAYAYHRLIGTTFGGCREFEVYAKDI